MGNEAIAVVGGKRVYYQKLKPWKYRLTRDLVMVIPVYPAANICEPPPPLKSYITLDTTGLLVISAGYATDGASGPTIDTPNTIRGSVVHDALYQLMRAGAIPMACKGAADSLLRDICIEDGMSGFRAALWYFAVKHFAGGAALANCPRPETEEIEAP